ncbi:MAG: acyl-CoA thioesterase [Chitinophagales bacterium]|nr:acyl-CoA thioesterase [Chitinophagales bacterium]
MSEVRYPYPIEINMQWGDQDALAHLNNVIFIRYFESARIHMLGITDIWQEFERKRMYFVLGKIECNYLMQVRFPQTLIVRCGIISIGNSSIKVNHQMIKKDTNELVADGIGIMVCLDEKSGKSVRIPDDIRELIHQKIM